MENHRGHPLPLISRAAIAAYGIKVLLGRVPRKIIKAARGLEKRHPLLCHPIVTVEVTAGKMTQTVMEDAPPL